MDQATMDAKLAALIVDDPELRALVEEHRVLDETLHELDKKVYLLPDEEVERKRLQKLKLAKKDKIAEILST
ncbi:MAG TPA: YdcH family protein [Candidatus Deferrimicrobiaceae bacterium]